MNDFELEMEKKRLRDLGCGWKDGKYHKGTPEQEVRKKELLKKYRSLKNLKEASVEELETILPKKIAIELHNYLKERNDL